jgi:hypothetical protein
MDIQALVDNGLTFDEELRVRALISADVLLSERYQLLLKQKKLLLLWWKSRKNH